MLSTLAVFSTYVEVFLFGDLFLIVHIRFLHVCGGVSKVSIWFDGYTRFSPRMWRCFLIFRSQLCMRLVFSTYVEVFLRIIARLNSFMGFLHVCGGVSQYFCSS